MSLDKDAPTHKLGHRRYARQKVKGHSDAGQCNLHASGVQIDPRKNTEQPQCDKVMAYMGGLSTLGLACNSFKSFETRTTHINKVKQWWQ